MAFIIMLPSVLLSGFVHLLPQIAGLLVCCLVIFAISLVRFRKQLA